MANRLFEVLSALASLVTSQKRIEAKLDELLLGNQFIRRHMSSYIGDGNALTYLDDETPIYVNSSDFGPPANFLNGGIYEQDNVDVLLSLVRDDTVFLDIGANLGFFALKIGRRVAPHGRVHAFEPHPELVRLARGSCYLNGIGGLIEGPAPVQIHQIGLGDTNGVVRFVYPAWHLGGGTQAVDGGPDMSTVDATIRRLDDFFPADFVLDLAKIDVEGHELAVVRGMRATLARSPSPKLLLEKLGTHCGYEDALEAELRAAGLAIHAVGQGAVLRELAEGGLAGHDGYVLACRPNALGGEMNRCGFTIHPRQFNTMAQVQAAATRDVLTATGTRGDVLFYGPYWFLRSGVYRVSVDAEIDGDLELRLAHRFGHVLTTFDVASGQQRFDVVIARDLLQFECIGIARSQTTSVALKSISFLRIG